MKSVVAAKATILSSKQHAARRLHGIVKGMEVSGITKEVVNKVCSKKTARKAFEQFSSKGRSEDKALFSRDYCFIKNWFEKLTYEGTVQAISSWIDWACWSIYGRRGQVHREGCFL